MKLVLFLGAGFSRGFGLPVMREFFSYCKSFQYINDDQRKLVETLQKKSRAAQGIITGEDGNLEHVLSLASMGDTEWNSSTFQKFAEVIWQVYRMPTVPPTVDKMRHSIQRLLNVDEDSRDFVRENHLTVVTTNYDVIGEFAFYTLGINFRLPFEWVAHTTQNAPERLFVSGLEYPLFCKLHGSLNWFRDEKENRLRVEDRIVPLRGPNDHKNGSKYFWPAFGVRSYAMPETPLITPPAFFNKSADVYPFPEIFNAARSAIGECDRLVFIGYSFPESDSHMRYFLGSALESNVGIESIDVIDPAADSIIKRLKESRQYGPSFCDKLRAFAGEWMSVKYSPR